MWKLLRNLVIVAVLCIALLKLVLWYETEQGASRLVQRLTPVAEVGYAGVSSSLDGDVTFHDLTVTVGKGTSSAIWRADTVDLRTPGALWLVRRVLLDDKSLPERLGVSIRGLHLSATTLGPVADSSWLNPLSLVPFETMGCGIVSRFSVADYQRMGLNPGVREQTLDYRYDPAHSVLTFSARVETPPFSVLSLHGEVQKFSPRSLTDSNWQKLHVSELSAVYADTGYLAKRNRFCALQAGVTPAQFVDQHVSAVEAFLAARGVRPSAEVVAAYRALVAHGGRISVLSLPAAGSTIGELLAESPDAMTRRLNLTARRNDAPPVMVRLEFQPETELAATDEAATSVSGEPPAAAAAAAGPTGAGGPAQVATATPAGAPVKPPPRTVAAARAPRPAASIVHPAKHAKAPPTAHAAGTSSASKQDSSTVASSPPPPPDSTLALVWQPTVDRLQRQPPPARNYDVISIDALRGYVGREARLITKTQKQVKGSVVRVDSNSVVMRIQRAGGSAELQVPRDVIVQVRVPHARRRSDDN